MISRRTFLAGAATLAAGGIAASPRRIPVILMATWTNPGFGDVLHTTGLLRLLEQHLPEVDVTFHASTLPKEVEGLLKRRFPKLENTANLTKALHSCRLVLLEKGPSPWNDGWTSRDNRYGYCGLTDGDADLRYRNSLDGAAFVYSCESNLLDTLKSVGVKKPLQEWCPDPSFSTDLKDDAKAGAFLKTNGLEAGRFACFVPRLRWNPPPPEIAKFIEAQTRFREGQNEEYREVDHAKLRAAIVAWVKGTGNKALLCPEFPHQIDLLKPLLFDPLPADIKPKVVVRTDFWQPDEAVSTFRSAAAVVSFETQSAMAAVAAGRPAIHVRLPWDPRKGQVWRDVGLGDWLLEIEDVEGGDIAERLLNLQKNAKRNDALLAAARKLIAERHQAMMETVAAQF